jgi:hypothetical protein
VLFASLGILTGGLFKVFMLIYQLGIDVSLKYFLRKLIKKDEKKKRQGLISG